MKCKNASLLKIAIQNEKINTMGFQRQYEEPIVISKSFFLHLLLYCNRVACGTQ